MEDYPKRSFVVEFFRLSRAKWWLAIAFLFLLPRRTVVSFAYTPNGCIPHSAYAPGVWFVEWLCFCGGLGRLPWLEDDVWTRHPKMFIVLYPLTCYFLACLICRTLSTLAELMRGVIPPADDLEDCAKSDGRIAKGASDDQARAATAVQREAPPPQVAAPAADRPARVVSGSFSFGIPQVAAPAVDRPAAPLSALRLLGFVRAAAFYIALAEGGFAAGGAAASGNPSSWGPFVGALGLSAALYALELRWRRTCPDPRGIHPGLAVILGIISAIGGCGIAYSAALILETNEGSGKGNLGTIRSALSIYYGDMDGKYPAALQALTADGKYLPALPTAKAPNYHPDSSEVHYGTAANDRGGWLYDNVKGDARFGEIWVNCTHTDSKGLAWSSY